MKETALFEDMMLCWLVTGYLAAVLPKYTLFIVIVLFPFKSLYKNMNINLNIVHSSYAYNEDHDSHPS